MATSISYEFGDSHEHIMPSSVHNKHFKKSHKKTQIL